VDTCTGTEALYRPYGPQGANKETGLEINANKQST